MGLGSLKGDARGWAEGGSLCNGGGNDLAISRGLPLVIVGRET